MMSALALALLLASQAAGAPAPVPAVRTRANLALYFSADDYPAAALRAEEQGSVFFRLEIAPSGRVSACTVTASSGSAALDNAACRILRSRVRATPARDALGNAVADTLTSSVHFSLPELDPFPERAGLPFPATRAVPLAPLPSAGPARAYPRGARAAGVEGIAHVWLFVGTDGRVRACRVGQTSGSAALDAATCRLLTSRARFAPARDGGAPACDVAEGAIAWLLPIGRRAARRTEAAIEADRPRPPAPVDAAALGCPGALSTARPQLRRRPDCRYKRRRWPPPPSSPCSLPRRLCLCPGPHPRRAPRRRRRRPPAPRHRVRRRRRNGRCAGSALGEYPSDALEAGAQGFVAYRLDIGPDGRVSHCSILQSSGSAALDAGTCRIVSGRSRFTPARDAEGRPVADTRDGWVTWRLQDEERGE